MYGIFTNIYPKNHPNVGKYTIHGAYGYQLIITNPRRRSQQSRSRRSSMHRVLASCNEFRRTGHGKVVGKTHGEFNFDGDVDMMFICNFLNIKLNMKFHGEKIQVYWIEIGTFSMKSERRWEIHLLYPWIFPLWKGLAHQVSDLRTPLEEEVRLDKLPRPFYCDAWRFTGHGVSVNFLGWTLILA